MKCQEGSRIRTVQPMETIEKKTDIAKCQILDYDDDRREECMAGAHSVVRSSYHLSSPVDYSINSCLVYDRSNCDWSDEGDGATGRFANFPIPTTAYGLRTRSFNIAAQSRKAKRTVIRCTTKFAFYGTSNIKTVQSPGACCFENRDRSCRASKFRLAAGKSFFRR